MTDNDNLELKKRSRRRLVGAGALALLAAIVLPMVMEQEAETPAHDIQITIPEREANTTLTRPIESPPAALVEPSAVSPLDAPAEAAPAPESPSVPAPTAGGGTERAAGDDPSAPAKRADVPAPAAPAIAEPSPVRTAPKVDDGARAMALLEGRTPSATIGNEAFVVQIAAFSTASKANALDAELKQRGFGSYTEKAGTVTRVRVGPFASRAEAQKVAERLHAGGMKGVVIAK